MTAVLDPYATLADVPLGWIGAPRLLRGTRDTDLHGPRRPPGGARAAAGAGPGRAARRSWTRWR